MIPKLIIFLVFLILNLVISNDVLGKDANFNLSYDITYTISPSGKTKVVHRTTIKNLTSEKIAGKSTVKIANLTILSPKAYDPYGALALQQSSESGAINFAVDLPNAASGKDNRYTWTLAFETLDLVVKQGKTYQVFLPNPGSEEVSDFKISVVVPPEFGKPSVVKPKPDSGLVWSKKTLGSQGVNLIFSPEFSAQYYHLNIIYSLENKKTTPVVAQVPVPGSTPYQRFFWEKSDPRPLDVILDQDGNFLAKFYLGAGRKEEIIVSGTVQVYSKPILTDYSDKATTAAKLELVGLPAMNSPEEIYRFVVENYRYEPASSADRNLDELLRTKGPVSCGEMTNLLTGIARDQGFAVKPVFGLLYPNRDRFHCWAAYLDPSSDRFFWIDPALEQISGGWDYFRQGDLSHIALYSGFKLSPKTVPITGIEAKPTVDFDPDSLEPRTSIRTDFAPKAISGLEYSGTVIVNNIGPADTGPIDVHISSSRMTTISPLIHFANLPPFSQRTISVKFERTSWTDSFDDIITVRLAEANYSYKASFQPFYQARGFITLTICAISLFVIAKISRRLRLQK